MMIEDRNKYSFEVKEFVENDRLFLIHEWLSNLEKQIN